MPPKLADAKIKKILDIPEGEELPDDLANYLIEKYRDWKEGIKKKLNIPESKKLPDKWLSRLEVKSVAQAKVENELEEKKNEIIELEVKITGLATRKEGLKEQVEKLKKTLGKTTDKEIVEDLRDKIRLKNQEIEKNEQEIKDANRRKENYKNEADNLHKQLLEEKKRKTNESEYYRDKWVGVVEELTKQTELLIKAEKDFADYKVIHPDTKAPNTTPKEKPKLPEPITGKAAITLLKKDEQIRQLLVEKTKTSLIFDISTDEGVRQFKSDEKKFDTTIIPYKCKSNRWMVFICYNRNYYYGGYAFFSSLNWNETNAPLIMLDVNEIQKTLIENLTGSIRNHNASFKDYSDKLIMRQQIFPQQEENIDSEIFPTGVIKKLLETDISIYSKNAIKKAKESQLNNIFNGFQISPQELVVLKAKYDEIVRQAQQQENPK